MASIFRSNYGGLLNRSTQELVDDFRRLHGRILEIDGIRFFRDAYEHECARNDRSDYAKQICDLSREINARFQSPEASARVIRDQEIDARIRAKWAA